MIPLAPPLGALDLQSIAWPLAFAAFGAGMFAMCTYRRNRVRQLGVEALEAAHRAMTAIERGEDLEPDAIDDAGPYREQLHTISSIGRRLAARTRHLSAIIAAEPECVKVVDPDGVLLEMNPAGLTMVGAASIEDVKGRLVLDLVAEEHREAFRQLHEDVVNGKPRSLTFEIVGLDGGRHWMETRAVPLADSTGRTVHLAITREVTARKQKEDEAREARQRAEAASQAKSDFLANMSHELRTPLTAILGFSDLLGEEKGIDREQASALRTIHGSAEHLLALISDVLDVSKIEAGHVELEEVRCDLREIVEGAVELQRAAAAESGVALSIDWEESVPDHVEADPVRVRQVLDNLLSNAMKFTPSGEVAVHLTSRPTDAAEDRMRIEIAVRDTGVGIDPGRIERLFSPFQQADSSTTRRFGGTGLGLSISRQLARLMGGDVLAESELGRGSVFTFVLMARAVAGSPGARPAAAPEGTVKHFAGEVLVVEDNPINQTVLCKLLERRGLEVELATNGLEGLERARERARSGAPYDLILMDMHMPVQDGYTTAGLLKAAEVPSPVVALTASAMAEDRRRCLDAGCDDYLPKPVDPDALNRLLAAYLEARQPAAETEPSATSG